MTSRNRSIGYGQSFRPTVHAREPIVPTDLASRITLRWIIRTCLTLSFVSAFLQYDTDNRGVQFAPMVLFCLAGLLVLCGRYRTVRLQNVLGGGTLLFLAMLFSEAISYTSHDNYSVIYGLVFIGIIVSARLVVQEIGVHNVFRAFSAAGILTVSMICVGGRHAVFQSEARFNGGTRAHPNLIAFFLGGYLPVILWRALEEEVRWKKRGLMVLALASFIFIFLSGSRGTLFAVLFAFLALMVRGAVARNWFARLRVGHVQVIAFLILFPLFIAFLLQHHRLGHLADFLNTSLALNSAQRGINSGLSGRTSIWHLTLKLLATQDRWLIGFGYRAGDRLVGTIDNGYVQLLFESGLIAGLMILGSMVRCFWLIWKASRMTVNTAWTRYYVMLWCLMIIYFLNNISTRYLFSFGSSFSLCVICLMVASRRELVGAMLPRPGRLPIVANVRPARALASDRTAY